ncbi:MAG TPA: hypothetical protein PKK23_10595 [Nitrospirales bacterium]|nr:hypothetical protein [Nitrospiraceae bacterium]HNP29486.1 hypothetical protein [Nitrospirales bacterium]
MTRVHTLLTGMSTLALVAAFSTPGLAAKAVINDAELDQVTAAGQPKIAMAQAYDDAYAENFQKYRIAGKIQQNSQEELRALTLNNVFGENQVANATNIQSADGTTDTSSQDNTVTQSWGAAKAMDYVKVAGERGGDVYVKSGKGLITQIQANGGDAAAGKIGFLWAFADEIADARSEHGYADAYNDVKTDIAGVIETDSQKNLNALTVNNVFGLNQVANALNIVSGAVTVPDLAAGGAASGTQQSNTVNQFRGTPANAADIVANAKL